MSLCVGNVCIIRAESRKDAEACEELRRGSVPTDPHLSARDLAVE